VGEYEGDEGADVGEIVGEIVGSTEGENTQLKRSTIIIKLIPTRLKYQPVINKSVDM